MGGTLILAAAAGAVAVLLAVRLWVVLRPRAAVPRRSLSLLVVAGSGGHTTEILRLLENLSDAYCPRHYIIADTDEMSAHKINSFEGNRADRNPSAMDHLGCWINSKGEGQSKERSLGAIAVIQFTEYYIHRIPRSREVQQSWLSTVLTTLYSMWLSFPLTHRLKPDLVLCNGPGTCVPICISALLLGILGIKKVIIVYVESICRVEHLSLSGKILFHLSDYFIVQWPTLKEKYPKSVYLGRIV
ncbi:UDP-N-acetylglucosamine transferase subunit ALG14 homolog isoform X2 [Neophocaena asiaeorientalis asiaeorientalis]|uniref:UDP-N-acetylglucosamine transferase subunit ALG14 n=2 Tax=Phocoenidae TaxID=9740 RepID=A0A341BXX7_NEOAA|nr:UDP-N-acetylglucosamine transferase subunit ALG14 homolog isoform X2 [Neophocaena asiaeorientalis asiaeorientalis]XP_032468473.1 UDP-N-acetylglucosamine transferase subunit ALG14 homolog isoform X5 [Phocoena sinus]